MRNSSQSMTCDELTESLLIEEDEITLEADAGLVDILEENGDVFDQPEPASVVETIAPVTPQDNCDSFYMNLVVPPPPLPPSEGSEDDDDNIAATAVVAADIKKVDSEICTLQSEHDPAKEALDTLHEVLLNAEESMESNGDSSSTVDPALEVEEADTEENSSLSPLPSDKKTNDEEVVTATVVDKTYPPTPTEDELVKLILTDQPLVQIDPDSSVYRKRKARKKRNHG